MPHGANERACAPSGAPSIHGPRCSCARWASRRSADGARRGRKPLPCHRGATKPGGRGRRPRGPAESLKSDDLLDAQYSIERIHTFGWARIFGYSYGVDKRRCFARLFKRNRSMRFPARTLRQASAQRCTECAVVCATRNSCINTQFLRRVRRVGYAAPVGGASLGGVVYPHGHGECIARPPTEGAVCVDIGWVWCLWS